MQRPPKPLSLLRWRFWLSAVFLAVLPIFLLFYKLGTLPPTLTAPEQQLLNLSFSWHTILHDPRFAPLTVPLRLLKYVVHAPNVWALRSVSAVYALLALYALAYILRQWYGTRSAVVGYLIICCSAWFLHVGRLGTTDVLYYAAIPLIGGLLVLWQKWLSKWWVGYVGVIGLAASLYVPGLVWIVVASLALQPHSWIDGLRRLSTWWQRAVLFMLGAGTLMPLAWALLRTPGLLKPWLGLPASWPTVHSVLQRLVHSLSFLFIHGPHDPIRWLDSLPVLDFFGIVMLLAGIVFYGRHWQAPRTRLLVAYLCLSVLLYAIAGPVSWSLIVPVIYIILVGGIGMVLHEWLQTFPRNPIARSLGFALLAAAIILSCVYNLRAYFIAWPHNPETVAALREHH